MSERTKIPWTQVTVNPFPGCSKVSPGCRYCYAETMARRLKAMGHPAYQDVVDEKGWTGKVYRRIQKDVGIMYVPGKGKMIFVNSMGDFFHESVPDIFRDTAMRAMQDQPWHIFQILTKRPIEAQRYLGSCQVTSWPLSNVWLGVSCENQKWTDERLNCLLKIPAAVRFVSFEPLLEDVTLQSRFLYDHAHGGSGRLRRMLHWVIVGTESCGGRAGRACKMTWVRSLFSECQTLKIPVFVKQIHHHGKLIKDPERIADLLNTNVEEIRQFPKGVVPMK